MVAYMSRPFYIFKEPIGQDRMARLASRGGDAVPSFGNGAGLPWSATSEQAMALAKESAALVFDNVAIRLHELERCTCHKMKKLSPVS